MSTQQQKQELYEKQMNMLRIMAAHGAISRAQFEKSSHDLTEKMGMASSFTAKDNEK